MFIKKVHDIERLKLVWKFAYEQYLYLGYIQPNDKQEITMFREFDITKDNELFGATDTFVILGRNSELIGSVSCTLDTPAIGLPVGHTFPEKVLEKRKFCTYYGLTLGCIWRILTKPQSKKCIIGTLLNYVFKWIEDNDVDIILIEVNPKHVKWYERLGFEEYSTKEQEVFLQAPAVLMEGKKSVLLNRFAKLCHRFFCE